MASKINALQTERSQQYSVPNGDSDLVANWTWLDAPLDRILGQKCVQAWLGMSEVLFIGFGSQILPENPANEVIFPDYQVRTTLATWRVLNCQDNTWVTLGELDDEREQATRAIGRLIGL